MMRLIDLKLLRIYGSIFPYCISFSRGPFRTFQGIRTLFVYLGNGKEYDWTLSNKVPLGERFVIFIMVGWDKAYCS
jgi:hypothetical protein